MCVAMVITIIVEICFAVGAGYLLWSFVPLTGWYRLVYLAWAIMAAFASVLAVMLLFCVILLIFGAILSIPFVYISLVGIASRFLFSGPRPEARVKLLCALVFVLGFALSVLALF
jgi:hypothetical protein